MEYNMSLRRYFFCWILVDVNKNVIYYLQTFHLVPLLQGSFFVQNEMFRLNYG